MLFKYSNFAVSVESDEAELPSRLSKKLGISPSELAHFRIFKKSLDARKPFDLKFVYSFVFELDSAPKKKVDFLTPFIREPFYDPEPGRTAPTHRPIIVGTGPAGLLAGYYLAKKGFKPLLIERGVAVKDRVPAIRKFESGGPHLPENNYLFGEGGAGCFSDGKLTCRISGPDVDWVLERFVETGGKPSIRYEHRPHLGSNRLPYICRNFRREIEKMGGEYLFNCRLEGLRVRDGAIEGVETSSGFIPSNTVILAIGHSARDTYEWLYKLGIPFEQKAFQCGLRIEQPQENINRHKYGKPSYLEILGAADYVLTARAEKEVFTFCMCAGGIIIPSVSEAEFFCTNGMSRSKHDTPFANSGVMVTLNPSEFGSTHPMAGMHLQRKYEKLAFELAGRNYYVPTQTVSEFLGNGKSRSNRQLTTSYSRGMSSVDLHSVLPPSVVQSIEDALPKMDQKWKGDFLKEATLVGPEMRGSSPVRILRDATTYQVPGFSGLYPVGEGAGYAGGIITAAVDGLRAARKFSETTF